MHLVTKLIALSSARPASEQVRLLTERRLFLKRRWRGSAEDGTEFGFDLESRLVHSGVILQTEHADYIVCQEAEPVWQLRFSSADQAALMGWKIGNLHFPVEILAETIRVPPDEAIRQLFEREAWEYEELSVIFNPLRVTAHAAS